MATPCQSPRSHDAPQLHDITSPTPTISPRTNTTPLHQPQPTYAAPSAFFNHDAYFDPNTPNASSRNHSYDSSAYDYSSQSSVPSTAHSEQSFGMGEHGAYYGYDQGSSSTFAFRAPSEVPEQTTPPAVQHMDDDRTPVISDIQRSIHPSHMPSASQSTPNGSSSLAKPLLSPFKSFDQQAQSAPPQHQENLYGQANMDPSSAPQFYYSHPPPTFSTGHTDPSFYPNGMQLVPYPMMPGMEWSMYYGPGYHPQPSSAAAGMGDRSPTGSAVSSLASSLARSASTNSNIRPHRPKVKLTKEDKRNIVELHRTDTSLRQEDIARRYWRVFTCFTVAPLTSSVDRSTISKILLTARRWTDPGDGTRPLGPPPPRLPKAVGGRFPQVEEKMSEWMDMQIALGGDVRDPVAREQAKRFAMEVGLGERFKGSAKWLDKFKERRKAMGRPIQSPIHQTYGYHPLGTTAPFPPPYSMPLSAPPEFGGATLSRSHSTVTISSAGSSSQDTSLPSPACIPADRMVLNRSEPDLIRVAPAYTGSTPTASRTRSQSSPQTFDAVGMAPMQTPSSGKAVRPSPLTLQRQNSYHGSSPSPRRPLPPSRANSSQGPFRRSRPNSLAASAFGITPIDGDGQYSPIQSPTTSASGSIGGHSRQRSECLTPFTASMATMALTQDIPDSMHSSSTSSVSSLPPHLQIPPHTPLTPITPANGSSLNPGVFPTLNPDLGDYGDMGQLQQQQQQSWLQFQQHQLAQSAAGQQSTPPTSLSTGHMPLQGYASMPNKHYGGGSGAGSYSGYSATGEFGQALGPQADAGQGYEVKQEPRWN